MYDEDIKIAGDHPSAAIKNSAKGAEEEYNIALENGNIAKAKALGVGIAQKFREAVEDSLPGAGTVEAGDMPVQRRQLLAFAVRIGLDKHCPNESIADSAMASFEKYLQANDPSSYDGAADNGALSFYFLAFRRGGEVERRVGQTFAMLCSHDGDPIYQELGEALYCWFSSFVQNKCREAEFIF